MHIFVDMDGTLNEFNKEASLEEVSSAGYFRNRPPFFNMVNAIKRLNKIGNNDIYILSSVFVDEHSIEDKNTWLDKYLPDIDRDHRIYVPYGYSKSKYIENLGISSRKSILIDDFTKNLNDWPGIGIKYLNGINNTKKTWEGFVVNGKAKEDIIYKTLAGIILIA